MSSAPPLLSIRLSVDYPNKPAVLRDISLDIRHGEILGLAGQSGSGKSTLALAILRLLHLKGGVVRGQIMFKGKDLLPLNERQLRSVRGRDMSIVLQSPLTSLNPALRIGSQLKEAWRAHGSPAGVDGLKAIYDALTCVCLPGDKEFLRRRPSQLSVGQAQRVIIAMAILHRPSLLIADEATSALDIITQSEILNLFIRLNRELNMAIFFISHDLLTVAALCHRVAILHEGGIVETGPPDMIFGAPQHEYTQQLVAALPLNPFRANGNAEATEAAEEALSENIHS
ncbi:MAG TPA: ABC transporter ATP-binding protein [Terriglobales bacterium]|nr:ABC transporter ATP-binding protein [Terriglobales bacterium]